MTSKQPFYDPCLLIGAVEDRPALWDQTYEGYKDRLQKDRCWHEVCCILIDNFEELPFTDQKKHEHSIVERWRNIRDAFAKSVKKEARDPSARKYLYSEKLSFLKSYLESKDMKEDVKPRFGIKRSYSEATPERVILKKDPPTPLPTSTSSSNSALDEDQAFFMSLLPSVKTLETDQKLQFRIEVMQLIQKLKNHSAGYDYQPFA